MADGSIKIKTKLDNTEAQKDLNDLEKMCENTAKNVEKTKAKVTVTTETDDGVSEKKKSKWLSVGNDSSLKKAQARLQAIREEIKKIEAETNKDLEFAVTDDQAAKLLELEAMMTKELNAEYEHLIQQVNKYQQAKKQATDEKATQKQTQDNFKSASKELSTEASATAFLSKIKTQEQYNAALSTTKARMAEIESAARRIAAEKGVDVNSLLRANNEYQKLSSKLQILKAHHNSFKKTAQKSFDGAKKAASKFGDAMSKGIKSIGKYALAVFGIRSAFNAVRQVVNTYMSDNEALKNSLDGIKGAFAEMLGPAIEKVVNLVKMAMSYVFAFIKTLTGVDYVAKYNAKALDKQAASTQNLAKAQKQLAGFDEMNKLNDSSSGGGGGGSDSAALFEPVEIGDGATQLFEKAKEQIEQGDWYGAGATVAQTLMDGIANTDWESLGTKIGNILMGVFSFALGFLTNIDAGTILDAMYDFAAGLLDGLSAGIQNLNWAEIGGKLLDMILLGLGMLNPGTLIASTIFTEKGTNFARSASEFAGSLVGALLSAIVGMAQRIGEIGQTIFTTIKDYFSQYVDWDDEPGEIIAGLFQGIVDALKNVGTWIYDNIWVPFRDGFKKAFDINSPSKKMKEFGQFLIDGLKEGIGNIWEKVKAKFTELVNKIITWKDTLKTKAKDAGTAFTDGLKNGFDTIKNKLKDPINAVIGMVEKAINWIVGKLNRLSWTIPDWVPAIGGKTFGFNIPTVSIPRLAKGGIVNNFGKGVPLIAGEAGREAILPLENNTEWMDILVDKISSGNITIPIYLDGKRIGEYIIDLQKRKAFAMNGG